MTDVVQALPDAQVKDLLRALRTYKKYLDEALSDADRAGDIGWPLYVVDFDLLHHFASMRESELVSEEVAAQHLFGYLDTTFVLGPGTLLELSSALRSMLRLSIEHLPTEPVELEAFVLSGALDAGPLRPALDELPDRLRRIHARSGHRLATLYALLGRKNFCWFSDLGKLDVDRGLYMEARHILDTLRPTGQFVTNNLADALNVAYLGQLRQNHQAIDGYPFLLSMTRLLLDQKQWSSTSTPEDADDYIPLARNPESALYGAVVREYYPEPYQAAEHVAALLSRIASVEERVRRERYRGRRGGAHWRSELLRAVMERGASSGFREYILDVAEVVGDPVIQTMQAQRDTVNVGTTNLARSRGLSARHPASVQQLFDLVVGIAAVLRSQYAVLGPAAWRLFISRERTDRGRSRRIVFRDSLINEADTRPDDRGVYLSVEYIEAPPGGEAQDEQEVPFFVFRWPVALNVEKLLAVLTHAFYRHEVDLVEVVVGVESRGPQYGLLELPLDYGDLASLFADSIHWMRIGCDDFDFYLDVVPASRTHPRLAVFVTRPHLGHIADLYGETSARFLERAWLEDMLVDTAKLAED